QKKVLSLVLCVAMMLSVMVVGAGAAFSDQSKIKNTEAVDACTALNIIGGYPDGSFKPEGNITRAEVTKMICVALNGGKEPNLATNATPTFSDVRTNANSAWAEKYIESCYAQGIVSGVGGGKFAPAGNVTGTQLAKMLLVALGYKSENEGFTGNAWATNVNTVASAKGLYAGLETIDPSAAITRDNAAQMVWNALNANEVEYKTNLIAGPDGKLATQITVQDKVVNSNNDKITLLEDKYDAIAVTGTLTEVKQDNGKSTYSITVSNAKHDGKDYATGSVAKVAKYTDVAKDYSSLKYQSVRVLVKPEKNGQDAVVYGVYATNKNTTQTGLLADLKMDSDGKKAKLDGTKYDLASETAVYVDGAQQYMKANGSGTKGAYVAADFSATKKSDFTEEATIAAWIQAYSEGNAVDSENNSLVGKGSTVELLATDGSTDYSILKVTTYSVEKITYVGSDYVTANGKKGSDDYVIASGLKKDDYALISAAGNYADKKGRVEKATVVEGKVTATKGTDKVMIDGNWYTMNKSVTAPKLNASVKLVLVNGYAYKVDTVTAGTSDVALIVAMGNNSTVGSKYYQARLILSDGTDKVVDIEQKDGNDVELIRTANATANTAATTFDTYAGKLCTYDVSKDVYTLTVVGTTEYAVKDKEVTKKVTNTEYAGYDNLLTSSSVTIDGSLAATFTSEGKVTSGIKKAYLNDTAVVFVRYKNGDYKVVSGKTVKGWDKRTGVAVTALSELDKNAQYAGVAYVDLGESNVPGGSDKTYAVALDSSYSEKIDGTTYTMVKAWNGTEEATYKYEGTKSISKGQIFEYSADGEGTVDITVYGGTDAMVQTYDAGSGEITFAAGKNDNGDPITLQIANLNEENSKIDSKDTVVLYVDSANGKGEKDGEIQLAPAFNGDTKKNTDKNVTVYVEKGEKNNITVIVVDVQNNMDWS
ncbi:S-layer homology domain-containing protein, partial [Evtepia sp.]|uniref:S-layer homology domain-containing protein n=1 Tax=Evtepia sp. TaxID=2773933 RepID=UPI002E764599